MVALATLALDVAKGILSEAERIYNRIGDVVDEVRGVAAQALPLAERLVHQPNLALLQVAQAAVDELRTLRRRAGEPPSGQ